MGVLRHRESAVSRQFGRAQALTLGTGVVNAALAVTQILPLSPAQHWAQMITGLVAMLLAWRPDAARLFGLVLVVGYGGFLVWHVKVTGQFGGWLPLRMVISGTVITVVARRSRPRGG